MYKKNSAGACRAEHEIAWSKRERQRLFPSLAVTSRPDNDTDLDRELVQLVADILD